MVTTAPRIKKFPPEVRSYFPFKPRPGQTLMANDIYYGVISKNDVAIEGAAGLGKTVTCLSALLPICKAEDLTLLYAARTHTQIQRVIEELSTIYKVTGHDLTGISLHGRANMCLKPEVQEAQPIEAMELCGILRRTHKCEWFENLKAKEVDRVSGCLTSDYIREYGVQAGICPYYLSKELLKHCRVVALTYIYLVNPFMRAFLFKTLEQNIENCILVFDECHNLPELTMHTMSIGETLYGIKRAIKEYNQHDPTGQHSIILKFLKHFKTYFDRLRQEYGEPREEMEIAIDPTAVKEYFETFLQHHGHYSLRSVAQEIQRLGREIRHRMIDEGQQARSSVFHFGSFLEQFLQTYKDVQYLHYIIFSRQRIQYYIRCIDCRGLLRPLQRARGIISMSGTLEPIDAYLEICGFPTRTRRRVLPSPFHQRKVMVLTCREIDITFYNRTEEQYRLLADRCLEVIRATPGNTAIFCASYEVLEGLLSASIRREVKELGRPFYSERRDRSSKENDVMIARFKADGRKGTQAVLVGVCGGRNSEGVDFPGPELLTVVILGIPLARRTHSVEALIAYYTEQFGAWKGPEYAYTLPALRRANQAAGRPIRTLHDLGVIVLLDSRYTWSSYRRFLSHWINENMIILENQEGLLEDEVARFYLSQTHKKVGRI